MKPPAQGKFRRITNAEKQAALTEAVNRYGNDILRFMFSFTRNWEEAEDLAQDVWVYAYRHFAIEKYQEKTLLLWKAKNLAISHYHKKQSLKETSLEHHHTNNTEQVYVEPHSVEEERAAYANFWDLFPGINLTEQQKQAFWYRERYGFTLKETGKKLNGTPTATIHDWTNIVKERCADYLNRRNQQ